MQSIFSTTSGLFLQQSAIIACSAQFQAYEHDDAVEIRVRRRSAKTTNALQLEILLTTVQKVFLFLYTMLTSKENILQ